MDWFDLRPPAPLEKSSKRSTHGVTYPGYIAFTVEPLRAFGVPSARVAITRSSYLAAIDGLERLYLLSAWRAYLRHPRPVAIWSIVSSEKNVRRATGIDIELADAALYIHDYHLWCGSPTL